MKTVSHHVLQRTARAKAARLDRADPAHNYVVVRAVRGPWRWRVERHRIR